MSTEHRMILAKLKRYRIRRNQRYCKECPIWPILAPKGVPMHEGGAKSNDIKKEVKKPTRTAQDKAMWIKEATWRLAY